ncbi:MAG: hypothetical protein FWD17_19900, partial [Polyangiaceae bacterium]|nr:hypothetical protein [Polyangiaceae bacterium]
FGDDLDLGPLRRGGGKGKVVAAGLAVAAAIGGIAVFAVVTRPSWAQPMLNQLGFRSSEATMAAAIASPPPPPPVEPAPAPAPPPEPVAAPVAAAPGGASPLNPHFAAQGERLNDEQKTRLLEADKSEKKGHGKKAKSGGGSAPSSPSPEHKPKSTTFTTGGSKYDPLNSSI